MTYEATKFPPQARFYKYMYMYMHMHMYMYMYVYVCIQNVGNKIEVPI